MIRKIADDVWKFTGSDKGNIYFLDFDKKIIIDTGNRTDREIIRNFLEKVIPFDKVDIVIFTHLHYDHCGNFDFFPNAKFYASSEEIECFMQDPIGTVLDEVVSDMLKVPLLPLPEVFHGLKVIKTPGHTKGSICLWDEKRALLFTGDTIFSNKMQGRVDLPTSVPDEMKNSIMKLIEIQYKTLCPGHDY